MGLTLPSRRVTGAAFTGGAVIGAAVAGLVGASDRYEFTAAHLEPSTPGGHVHPYSVKSCPDGDNVDPVSTVFTGTFTDDLVIGSHFVHHDSWQAATPEQPQYFRGHGHCKMWDGSRASRGCAPVADWPPCEPLTRYHARYWVARAPGSANYYDLDPQYGLYALSTPHHEARVTKDVPCVDEEIGVLGHAVYDNEIPNHATEDYDGLLLLANVEGGFVQARERILHFWGTQGHSLTGVQMWNNTEPQQQAEFDPNLGRCWRASNYDGIVYYIATKPDGGHDRGSWGKGFF